MRLTLQLRSIKNSYVPFNYQPQLTGKIHKWLGENDWHDSISLYSFSWLKRGEKAGKRLSFERGADLEISAHDPQFLKYLVKGIQSDPLLGFGLIVTDVTIQEPPAFSNKELLHVSSPVLVKRTTEDKEVHYTYDDDVCTALLTGTMQRKLRMAGLPDENVKVSFQNDFPGAKTKLIYYNNIGNKVNICPVVIEGTPEQIAFAWNVGVGNSTGIGFGALK